MKKILLSFVGDRDPYANLKKPGKEDTQDAHYREEDEGSVLSLCRKLRPDIVYLFPSAKMEGCQRHTEEKANWAKSIIEKEILPDAECYIRPLFISDATNFGLILPEMRRYIREIIASCDPEECVQYNINSSSGTQQMTASFYVLASSGILPDPILWQVKDPRYLSPGENRISQIPMSFVEEENILGRIRKFMSQQNFRLISEELEQLRFVSLSGDRRNNSAFLSALFNVYNAWDLMQFKEASVDLKKFSNHWKGTADFDEIAEILKLQVNFLEEVYSTLPRENPYNLIEVYKNAERCFARGAYADTLARIWRLCEGLIYERLRNRYGVEPAKLRASKNRENLGKIKKYAKDHNWGNPVYLGYHKGDLLLQKLFYDGTYSGIVNNASVEVFPGSEPWKIDELMVYLKDIRNHSVIAHGMSPLKKEDAQAGLAMGTFLLKNLMPNAEEMLSAYPMQVGNLEKILKIL